MIFEVTKDNKSFLDARGRVILNACPGSGKTTAIAFKLQSLMNDCKSQYGNFSGVACLSFTNVAKNEINEKYQSFSGRRISYPHIVTTIYSFINSYITLPFYYLLELEAKRPIILEDSNFLNDISIGFYKNHKGQLLRYIYRPSNITIENDGSYTYNGYKPDPQKVNIGTFNRYCESYKNWQFNKGFLKNDDSVIAAIRIINKFPEIAKYLVKRFPIIIVDEAQDTSESQFEIFDQLISNGLQNIELIGDPYQSLYEFRNARPDLFIERFNDSERWRSLRIFNCRRSSQRIIDVYCKLRVASEKQVISISRSTTNYPLNILIYDPNSFEDIIIRFSRVINMQEENQILVRGSNHLEKFGVKINKEEPWKSTLPYLIIESQKCFANQNIKQCIDILRKFMIELLFSNLTPFEKKIKGKELKEDLLNNILLMNFIKNLPSTNSTLKEWSEEVARYINVFFNVDNTDLQLKKNKGIDYYNQKVNELFKTEIDSILPISTIHKVKGMSFDSILLVLSEDSSGQNISLRDIYQPASIPSEKQRLIYVAMSRPKKLLCLAIPNNFSKEEIQRNLGEDVMYI